MRSSDYILLDSSGITTVDTKFDGVWLTTTRDP